MHEAHDLIPSTANPRKRWVRYVYKKETSGEAKVEDKEEKKDNKFG